MDHIWLDEDEQRTWRSVILMHAQLGAALAQGLKTESDMSISDYEVLAILSEAPGGTLRARELRCQMQWEKSRLAHHIRRMEQRGYVRRDACADDLRAPIISITELGLSTIRAAAPAHVAHVRQLFFDALTTTQLRTIREAADAVLENIALHTAPETTTDE